MTPHEIIRLGIEMRTAQKQFFKTRDRSWLVKSKELEKKFDTVAAQAFASPGETDK